MFLRNYDNYLLTLMGATIEPANGKSVGSSTSNFDAFYSDYYGTVIHCGSSSNGFGTKDNVGDGYISYRTVKGSIAKTRITNLSGGTQAYLTVPTILGTTNICLGTGTDEVTYEDYKLSGDIISNSPLKFQSDSYELAFDNVTKKFRKKVTFTYSNTTDSDITISEWGMYGLTSSDFAKADYATTVLFFREVLSEPITIAAGTTSTLTFSVDLPMPNHP